MDYLKAGIAMLAGAFISFSLWYLYRLMLREKEATRAKDLFFSNISHDMRTPLNAVIGFASLARKPELSEAQKDDYLKKISTSGNLLLDLVNDTLSISRMTNGKYRLSPEPVSTQDLGASILPSVEALAKAKGITFYADNNSYRPRTILADRLNTEKIFLNLLTNAVKYTPPGGHIWASVADDPPEGANPDLVFTLRDDGIGMSEAFIKELYEPFAQENRPGYESKGTGLGLAIVRELVDLMGGTIAVTSQMDCGTTFVVRLHFDEITAPALPEAPEETEAAPAALTGKRILLCEDNALNQEIACAFLKDWGLTVTTAADGQAGIDAFTHNPPDTFCAVLMDLRMPVLNGYDAARAIRALDRPDAKTIPIIAMSADAFADDVQKCRDAGMDGHIAKPIDVAKLHTLLTALCQSRTGP
jgi:CheY-like chemotaxis protein